MTSGPEDFGLEVSARITVDATGLREEARAKVAAEVRRVRATIKTDLDTRGLAAKARAAAAEAAAAAKVRIQTTVDTRGLNVVTGLLAKLRRGTDQVRMSQEDATRTEKKLTAERVKAARGLDQLERRLRRVAQAEREAAAAATTAFTRTARVQAGGGSDEEIGSAKARADQAVTKLTGVRDTHAEVKVDVDAAKARLELAELARKRHAEVEVDADPGPVSRFLSGFQNGLRKLGTGLGKVAQVGGTVLSAMQLPAMIGLIGAAVTAVIALGGGLIAVVAAASQAVGVIGALPGLFSTLLQGIGTLFAGLSGIGGAVKALGAAQKTAGVSAVNTAKQQQAAAQRVADATENLGLTQQAAARRVADAELAVTDAQEGARDAQLALNQARKDAAIRLRDLRLQLSGAALDEEQAQLQVEEAAARLRDVQASALTSPFQRREADLAYRDAVQRLAEVKQANQDLRKAATAQQRAGVEGDSEVVSAKKGVRQATRRVSEAEQALADARRDGAREVRNAQRELVKAEQELADQGAKTTATQSALADAMDKLSPAGRRFAQFIAGTVIPQLRTLRTAAAEALLPPLQDAISKSLTLLPTLREGLAQTGAVIGGVAQRFGAFFATPAFRGDLATIMAGNARATGQFGNASLSLTRAFTDITVAAQPLIRRFSDWIAKLADGWQKSIALKRATGDLATFFQNAGNRAAELGRIVHGFGSGILGIFRGAIPLGNTLLGKLDLIGKTFGSWANSKQGQQDIQKFFAGLAPVLTIVGKFAHALLSAVNAVLPAFERFVGALGQGLIDLLPAIVPLFNALADALTSLLPAASIIAQVLARVLTVALKALQPILPVLADALVTIATALGDALVSALQAVAPILPELVKAIVDLALKTLPLLPVMVDLIALVVQLARPLLPLIDLSAKFALLLNRLLAPALSGILRALTGLVSGTINLVKDIGRAFGRVAGAITAPFVGVLGYFSKMWGTIKNVFVTGINGAISVVNALLKGANWVLSHLHIPVQISLIPLVGQPQTPKGPGNSGGAVGGGSSGRETATFSTGGVLPGYAPGQDTVDAKLSPGEGVLVPEAVRAVGPAWVYAINRRYSRGRGPGPSRAGGYAGGGVVGGVTGAVTTALGKIKDLGAYLLKEGAKGLINGITPIAAAAMRQIPGLPGQLGGGLVHTLGDGLISYLDGPTINIISRVAEIAATAGSQAAAPVGDAVGRWAPLVGQVLKELKQPLSLIPQVLQVIKFESGGNPKAINLTDVNAQRGDPSRGLMQTIGATFNRWAGKYLPRGIYDPLANIYAALRYGIGRYGAILNIPGIQSLLHGGPYLPYDNGGMLPTGLSTVYNGTGQPEPVFTQPQWETLHAAFSSATRDTATGRGGGGNTITVIAAPGEDPAHTARLVDRELAWSGA